MSEMTVTGGRGGNEHGKAGYHIVRVDNVAAGTRQRYQYVDNGDGCDYFRLVAALYMVVKVDDSGAHVVDDMYSNVEAAAKAWPEATVPMN